MCVTNAFKRKSLYVITDSGSQRGKGHLEVLTDAIRGGASFVQLRDKEADDETLLSIGRALRKVCDQYGACLIVNERIAVANSIGADGLHIGQDNLPIQEARQKLGKNKLLGVSTHSLAQAKKAFEEGADYIGVGPIFKTPTKPDTPPVGLELIREVKESVPIPFFAIGGICLSNLTEVLAAGADSVAVVRAVVGQEKIDEAAKEILSVLRSWEEDSEKDG